MPEDQKPEFQPITSQQQLDDLLRDRLQRERNRFADYDDMKAKAARLDEIEQQNKTELERIAERAKSAESDATNAKARSVRLEVALEKGLTTKQAARLVGTTREELLADADDMLADLPAPPPPAEIEVKRITDYPNDATNPSDEAVARSFFGV